ncbi:hypothetical protein [Melaminivora alkalimesophila]|uniref:Uncharacterized protein n=1 Tax=Melaminivora alkalimesophila TaxID=1165852 RepID=A0A317RAD8_9BURK|nr:hypothetical protein [Melaminivora alkalimesophila]PWW45888.1 hypothetical protein DFR36_10591 [Melaminivora alkalimesophila]
MLRFSTAVARWGSACAALALVAGCAELPADPYGDPYGYGVPTYPQPRYYPPTGVTVYEAPTVIYTAPPPGWRADAWHERQRREARERDQRRDWQRHEQQRRELERRREAERRDLEQRRRDAERQARERERHEAARHAQERRERERQERDRREWEERERARQEAARRHDRIFPGQPREQAPLPRGLRGADPSPQR